MSYDLNKAGFKKKYNPTSAYDLNGVGGFGKKCRVRFKKDIENKVREKSNSYDLNKIGGFSYVRKK
jgi:hypothetical protein